jgi:hypothetical protein
MKIGKMMMAGILCWQGMLLGAQEFSPVLSYSFEKEEATDDAGRFSGRLVGNARIVEMTDGNKVLHTHEGYMDLGIRGRQIAEHFKGDYSLSIDLLVRPENGLDQYKWLLAFVSGTDKYLGLINSAGNKDWLFEVKDKEADGGVVDRIAGGGNGAFKNTVAAEIVAQVLVVFFHEHLFRCLLGQIFESGKIDAGLGRYALDLMGGSETTELVAGNRETVGNDQKLLFDKLNGIGGNLVFALQVISNKDFGELIQEKHVFGVVVPGNKHTYYAGVVVGPAVGEACFVGRCQGIGTVEVEEVSFFFGTGKVVVDDAYPHPGRFYPLTKTKTAAEVDWTGARAIALLPVVPGAAAFRVNVQAKGLCILNAQVNGNVEQLGSILVVFYGKGDGTVEFCAFYPSGFVVGEIEVEFAYRHPHHFPGGKYGHLVLDAAHGRTQPKAFHHIALGFVAASLFHQKRKRGTVYRLGVSMEHINDKER